MNQARRRMSQAKTQILITGVPKTRFTAKWPEDLEKQLFVTQFPQHKSKLSYYSPLAFLNRIVIILDDEESAKQIYEFLQPIVTKAGDDMKIFLTESLLVPRSRSVDDTANVTPVRKGSITEALLESGKPILSLDTNPSNTGVNANSLSIGSPSLSPQRNNAGSPTLLKFSDDSKPCYYKEPLPQSASQTILTSISDNSISPISSNVSQVTPDSSKKGKPAFLRVNTFSTGIPGAKGDGSDAPRSPSITVDHFVQ